MAFATRWKCLDLSLPNPHPISPSGLTQARSTSQQQLCSRKKQLRRGCALPCMSDLVDTPGICDEPLIKMGINRGVSFLYIPFCNSDPLLSPF